MSRMSRRFEDIPNAEIVCLKAFDSHPQGLVCWDVDQTVVAANDQQDSYLAQLKPIAEAAKLDWDFVLLAHDVERRVANRQRGGLTLGGVETLFPMVAAAMGSSYQGDKETLAACSLQYQQLTVSVETRSPIVGALEALKEARQQWPNVAHIAVTLCPRWLTELRLMRAELLELFHGYVGVAHQLPKPSGHPYACAVSAAHEWLADLAKLTGGQSARHALRVGIPAEYAKPDPCTLQALTSWAKVPMSKVLMVDDNPHTGLRMAHETGAVGVHAAYGCSDNANPEWPPFGYAIQNPSQILAIMEEVFGRGVA